MVRYFNDAAAWTSIGFSQPGKVTSFVVNRGSSVLALLVQTDIGEDIEVGRIYLRTFNEATYQSEDPGAATEEQADTKSWHDAKLILLTSSILARTPGDTGWSSGGRERWTLDLMRGTRTRILRSEELVVDSPYVSAFIRTLIDVRPDGTG